MTTIEHATARQDEPRSAAQRRFTALKQDAATRSGVGREAAWIAFGATALLGVVIAVYALKKRKEAAALAEAAARAEAEAAEAALKRVAKQPTGGAAVVDASESSLDAQVAKWAATETAGAAGD